MNIGDVQSSGRADASRNKQALRDYLRSRVGTHAVITVVGDVWLDLSDGPLVLAAGGRGQPHSIVLQGPGRLIGVTPQHADTPVLEAVRAPGTAPLLVVRDLDINSEGPGIRWRNGGARSRIDNVLLYGIGGGSGPPDQESFDDVWSSTASYGLRVDDADGMFVRDLVVFGCTGHGVACTRWHKGVLEAYCRDCLGCGFKLQQANDLYVDARAESNHGYGFFAVDSGINRYESRKMQASDGAPNLWRIWNEANNGRGITGSHGYRFSQMKLDNVARCTIVGHSGWQPNQVRLDACSRECNTWIEEVETPTGEPLFAGGPFSLPQNHWGDRRVTNWDLIWPYASHRPTVQEEDAGVVIRWPAGSFENTAVGVVAYWRPWGGIRVDSPGTFIFSVKAVDRTGAISDYCRRREAAHPRQVPCVAEALITPVAGAITGISLWDKLVPHEFVGRVTVRDSRQDIGLGINAWSPGMGNTGSTAAAQREEHVLYVEPRLWRIL